MAFFWLKRRLKKVDVNSLTKKVFLTLIAFQLGMATAQIIDLNDSRINQKTKKGTEILLKEGSKCKNQIRVNAIIDLVKKITNQRVLFDELIKKASQETKKEGLTDLEKTLKSLRACLKKLNELERIREELFNQSTILKTSFEKTDFSSYERVISTLEIEIERNKV